MTDTRILTRMIWVLLIFCEIISRNRLPDARFQDFKKAPVSFPTGANFIKDRSKNAFAVNVSGGNGFSAADIPEPEREESGDQSDREPAGERSAESVAACDIILP